MHILGHIHIHMEYDIFRFEFTVGKFGHVVHVEENRTSSCKAEAKPLHLLGTHKQERVFGHDLTVYIIVVGQH